MDSCNPNHQYDVKSHCAQFFVANLLYCVYACGLDIDSL